MKSVDDTIKLLNGALELDRETIQRLVDTRLTCNNSLVNHATIQVSYYNGERYTVGLLGILNGLFGADTKGNGAIAAVYDVVCVNCNTTMVKESVGAECPNCEEKLVLGKLLRFERFSKYTGPE